MKIAHRKNVLFRDRQWWDTAVNLCSGNGGYAHSELVFSNGESFTSTTDFDRVTVLYPRVDTVPDALRAACIARKNGPLIRRIEYPVWEWDFTELHITDSQELQVYAWCKNTIDESLADRAGYDWAGVLRFVFKFLHEHKKDWFCSEAVVAACQQAGCFLELKPWTVSPNRLRDLCREIETAVNA